MRNVEEPLPESDEDSAQLLRRFERLAYLLDAKYRVPGTRFHFGWDALVGIVPVVGDLAMAAVSLALVNDARRLGATPSALARMAGNVALDFAIGSVPFVGPIFDALFRANLRNLSILLTELESRIQMRGSPQQ